MMTIGRRIALGFLGSFVALLIIGVIAYLNTQKLIEESRWVTHTHEVIESIYFNDPNGIALEASWWVVDPTGRIADYADPELFSDPNPVPAVRELQRTGRVETVPHTTLASDEVMKPA